MSQIYLFQLGTAAIGVAVVFVLILAVAAFVAFKMLAKSVKMAFRMIIVAIILLVALAGGAALLMLASDDSPKKPAPARTR